MNKPENIEEYRKWLKEELNVLIDKKNEYISIQKIIILFFNLLFIQPDK